MSRYSFIEQKGSDKSDMRHARSRIESLRVKIQDSLHFTVDRLFTETLDSYFSYEEQLDEMDRLLGVLLEEVDVTVGQYAHNRLHERIQYIEDRFEEIDSGLRGRPRRVRRKFSFFNFFREYGRGGGGGDMSSAVSEVSSSAEAYQILELESGESFSTIKKAFRRAVKGLHPDSRGGDRSTEPELRKLIAAYQFLKKELTGKG